MNIYGFPLNAYLNKVTVRSDRLRTVLVVYVNGQRWSAQTCIACSAPIRKKRRVLFSMPSSLFVPFPLRCVLSLQSPGQGTCVDQECMCDDLCYNDFCGPTLCSWRQRHLEPLNWLGPYLTSNKAKM